MFDFIKTRKIFSPWIPHPWSQMISSKFIIQSNYSLINKSLRIFIQFHYICQQNQMKLIKRSAVFQQLIDLLLIFRPYLECISTSNFVFILLTMITLRHFIEGNTAYIVLQIAVSILMILGQISCNCYVIYFSSFLAALCYKFQPNTYHLPELDYLVGLNEHNQQFQSKNLYWVEWFRVNQKPFRKYQIPWANTIQLKKMSEHLIDKRPYLQPFFNFINSGVSKLKINLAAGQTLINRPETVIFSHGRGATIFMYSLVQRHLAKNYKVLACQHSQVNRTPYTDMNEIKKYREKQVSERAKQIQFLALEKVGKDEKIILAGQSYGGSTILQAYRNPEVRKKVSKIILLDPWLFPLKQQDFKAEISCPILMLPNQFLVEIQDVYERNKIFINLHKDLTYVNWKKGDHLQQTDMGFIVGNQLRKIKNSELSAFNMEMNIRAMEMFLNGEKKEKIEKEFGQWNLGRQFKPKKWNNYLNF